MIPIIFLLLVGPVHSHQPAEMVRLIGRVVDAEDGSAVPSGSVVLSQDSGRVYELRIRAGQFAEAIAAGDGYRMAVRAPGFADLYLNHVSVRSGMDPFTLRLRRVWAVTGQVVDPQGRPVAGARVGLSADAEGTDVPIAAVTDERGSFRMEFPVDRGVYFLLARKAGYQQSSPESFVYPPDGELRIELTPGPVDETGSVSGLAASNGRPLTGRKVRLLRSGGEEVGRAGIDARGEFLFSGVAPGEYELLLESGNPADPGPSRLLLQVEAGEPTRAEFRLFEGRISGIVSDLEGEPVREALVSLSAGLGESEPLADNAQKREALRRRNSRKHLFHHVQTDERGRFVFAGIEPGPYLLRVDAGPQANYAEQTMSVEIPAHDDLKILLEPGLVLRGLLLDQHGAVIKTFGYAIEALDDPTRVTSAHVNSLQGLFSIRGLRQTLYSFSVALQDGRQARGVIDLNRGANILFRMPAVEGDELLVHYETG